MALSNRLYVQTIGSDDRIRSLEALDIGDAVVTRVDIEHLRATGDLALWGFQFSDGSCAVDVRDILCSHCDLEAGTYSPLLRLQISTLFDKSEVETDIAESYRHLIERAPRSSDFWRDLIILLPRVRRTTFANLQRPNKSLRAAIDGIDLVTRGDALTLGVPPALIEHFGSDLAFANSLQVLKPIFAALGIARLDVQQRTPCVRADRHKESATRLVLIHCLRDADAAPARKLRDVRHVLQSELVSEEFKRLPGPYPDRNEKSLLLVEDNPDQIEGARAIAEAMGGRASGTYALIIPSNAEKRPDKARRLIVGPDRFAGLAGACQWLAYAGDVIDYDEERYAEVEINPHLDRHTVEIARWTPHALRACLTDLSEGQVALEALNDATNRYRSLSIATMASRGSRAAETATDAALSATQRGPRPASKAQFILMVAFHNRGLGGDVRNEIERAVRACNPQALVKIVEEHREDMVKRVRVVAFITGHQRVTRESYTPPAKLMPLVRAGWRVEPAPYHARWQLNTISHAGSSYILRFEPDRTVTLDSVGDLIQSTSFHHGKVALLVDKIVDDGAVDHLLSAGIFCGLVANRQSFDRFGPQPGEAIRSALTGLSRREICDRLRCYARHYLISDLWHLVPAWQVEGLGTFERWRDGSYEDEPEIEKFELYRMAKEGVWHFRGIIHLKPKDDDTPNLQYEFGLAFEASGFRRTRLKPVDGSYDLRADARRRFEERYFAERGRHFGKNASTRNPAPGAQMILPDLSDFTPDRRK